MGLVDGDYFSTDSKIQQEFRRLVSTTPGSFPLDEDVERDLIELSSGEDEDDTILRNHTNTSKLPMSRPTNKVQNGNVPRDVIDLTLDSDDDDDDNMPKLPANDCVVVQDDLGSRGDDDSMLTLNEPKTARKPLATPAKRARKAPNLRRIATSNSPDSPHPNSDSIDSFWDTPNFSTTPNTTRKAKAAPATPRAGGKKATAIAERVRREAYAQKVFDDLNRKVFSDGIPDDTKLNWNVRLLTTAGRAKWHRSKDGLQTVEIELAVKILDDDARIRNTLAHEMCHLACWIIDKNPQENHGRLFKSWATKVMHKMPHIEVTTKHSYDINHPYEWKCEQCSKIYGRFSRSIRPDECVCGACRVGRLVPLFTTRTTSKKVTGARNASPATQDSPQANKGFLLDENATRHDDKSGSDEEELERLMRSLDVADIAA